MRNILLLCLIFCSGCATLKVYQIPAMANFNQKVFEIENQNTKNILYISHQNNTYYFALFDALGAPIVSKILEKNKFSNTKFMPPNNKYNQLFIHILMMIEHKQKEIVFEKNKVREIENIS